MKLVLPYSPSANRYWRVDRRGFNYVSPEAKLYKRRVQLIGMAERIKPLEGPLSLSLTVYRPRRVGDLSNRIKVLEDALQGIAFEDDDQIEAIHALRLDDPANPRVEVQVEPLPWRAR